MHKKIVVGNWKVAPSSIGEAKDIFVGIRDYLSRSQAVKHVSVIIAPPFTYIHDLTKLAGKNLLIGAQDIYSGSERSATGEISGDMLYNMGVRSVIVGHSERRNFGETNEAVAQKAVSAVRKGIHPIVCVGEKTRDDGGDYFDFVAKQLRESLVGIVKRNVPRIIIAYEPVFAIGAKKSLEENLIGEMVIYIRKNLIDIFGDVGARMPILYGGAVNSKNTLDIIKGSHIQGLLVGRVSLVPRDFFNIIEKVSKS